MGTGHLRRHARLRPARRRATAAGTGWPARRADRHRRRSGAGTNLVWAAMFTDARIALHEGRIDAAARPSPQLNVPRGSRGTRRRTGTRCARTPGRSPPRSRSSPGCRTRRAAWTRPRPPGRRTTGPPPAWPGPPDGCTMTGPRSSGRSPAGSGSTPGSSAPARCCCSPTGPRKARAELAALGCRPPKPRRLGTTGSAAGAPPS